MYASGPAKLGPEVINVTVLIYASSTYINIRREEDIHAGIN